MRKLHLIILICFLSPWLRSQPNLDSLRNVWQDETQPDTSRLTAVNDLIWKGYKNSQPDSAFFYAQLQYDLAEKIGRKKDMSRALNTLGTLLMHWNNYPKALDHFQRAIDITEEIGDTKRLSAPLVNMGIIYHGQPDLPKALEHYKRGLSIMEETGDERWIPIVLINIGIVYGDQQEYPEALEYFQRSLKMLEEAGNKPSTASVLMSIGNLYQRQGNFSKAMDCYQRSLKINEEFDDRRGIALVLRSIGIIFQEQEDHQEAINECGKSMQQAKDLGAISLQEEACKCLYDSYKALGNGNKALEYHEQMLVLNDSLKEEDTVKKLQQMEFAKQMLADSLKKEEEKLKVAMTHQQEVAKKDRTRNLLMGSGLLLLLAAIGLYSRVRYVRRAKNRIEKEKDRSENLLLNILPAEIAEELKEKGEAAARDFDMVTILFTDFKGFTQASEKLSAVDLVAEINTCFKAFDGIVGKYNIEKIKTIGDAYMAAGGLPVPDENAAKNTVLAGLEMQAFMKSRKAERDAQGLPAFEMRVGIHTGPVVAGIVGVKKFQYDIWGDTVNTASRMESSGAVGQVNISEATCALVKDNSEFGFTSRGKVAAKGKGEMEMYFVSKA